MSLPAPADCNNLNDAQRAALDLDRDLLVDAGAGAGKTRVLALRYLALLEEGRARVPDIVAFTFTDKAAAEMKGRVRNFLDRRIAQLAEHGAQADTVRERLTRARTEFHRNAISTVHSFCYRTLRAFAFEAGLEPGVPLMDEREQARVRRAAVNAVLQRTPPESALGLREALEHLGSVVSLNSLHETLLSMLEERHDAALALELACKVWSDPDAEVVRRRTLIEADAAEALAPVIKALNKLPFAAARRAREGDKLRLVYERLAALKDQLPQAPACAELFEVLMTKEGKPGKFSIGAANNWKGVNPGLDEAREALKDLAQQLAAVPEIFEFDETHERLVGRTIIALKAVFDAVLAAFARECEGRLDFLELELRTLKLLETPVHADEIARQIRYLLVDEFQDTNPTQARLFSMLMAHHHRPGRFFAVGDAKQSIYGFRGSDVGVFNDARRAIPARNAALADTPQRLPFNLTCKNKPERRGGIIALDTNYRSLPTLLEVGNRLFDLLLGGERRFDVPPQALKAGVQAEATNGNVKMLLLPAGKQSPDNDGPRDDDEAELVARAALEFHKQGVPWREIAVLVRRATNNEILRDVFARHDIPLVLFDQAGLLKTQEAFDCINLLRVLVDADDDTAALGLLRSPFCGLSDRALTEIALASQGREPLLARVERASLSTPREAEVQQRFFAQLGDWRSRVDREPPSVLLARALADAGYALAAGCGATAEQRLANLDRLVETVREIPSPSLAVVCRELRERMQAGEDDTQGSSDADGVRLMTIHKSKGMEFTAVIVPDIGNRQTPSARGILRALPEPNRAAGLFLRLQQGEKLGAWRPDFAAWQAARVRDEQAEAEELRVLYTAFTRAARNLTLIGRLAPKDLERATQQSPEKVSWGARILAALGCAEPGEVPADLPPGLVVEWLEKVEHSRPVSHARAIKRIEDALAANEIPLAEPLDASLVAPLAEIGRRAAPSDHNALEIGVMIHGAIEQFLRQRCLGGEFEAGLLPRAPEIRRQVQNACEALDLLPRAQRELAEWRLFGEYDGHPIERRLDLLRVLSNDEYEIIDFKTDVFGEIPPQQAAARYRDQLGEYRDLLAKALAARGKKPRAIRTYVCFTQPALEAAKRLVEV